MYKNTYSKNIKSIFPTKYYEEADNRMLGTEPYLYKEHVDPILQLFSPLDKEIIRRTTWYSDTGEPVLAS